MSGANDNSTPFSTAATNHGKKNKPWETISLTELILTLSENTTVAFADRSQEFVL